MFRNRYNLLPLRNLIQNLISRSIPPLLRQPLEPLAVPGVKPF
jgi:hypothetical protein